MNKIINFFMLIFFLGLAGNVNAIEADSYLCTADMATGFKYNKEKDKWETASFEVDEKYIVSRVKSKNHARNYAFAVKKYKGEETGYMCDSGFNRFGHLICGGGVFRMNKYNLRYILSVTGYYNSKVTNDEGRLIAEEGKSNPYIEIGRCSRL